MMLFTLTLGDP